MNKDSLPYERVSAQPPRILLTDNGFIAKPWEQSKLKGVQPTWLKGKKRAKIGKWSVASQRRFRETLLMLRYDHGEEFAMTFTFPGADLTHGECKQVFKWWAWYAKDHEWSAVWRLQVQQRGTIHYHLWLCVPVRVDWSKWAHIVGAGRAHSLADPERVSIMADIKQSWLNALDSIGPRPLRGCDTRLPLSMHAGADRYSVDFGKLPDSSGCQRTEWRKYMCQHLRRKEQAAEDVGRQWGIIGRKGFTHCEFEKEIVFDDEAEYNEVMMEYSEKFLDKRLAKVDKIEEHWAQENFTAIKSHNMTPVVNSDGSFDLLTSEQKTKLQLMREGIKAGYGIKGKTLAFGRSDINDVLSRHGLLDA